MQFTEYDTRIAAYGLLTSDDGQILLTWFNGSARSEPCWTMPGGGVEFDESIRDAVAREVFEEIGYRVNVGPVLAEHHLTLPRTDGRRPFRSQRFILAATIMSGQLGTTETGGTTGFAKWVSTAEVPSLEPRADIVDVAMSILPTCRTLTPAAVGLPARWGAGSGTAGARVERRSAGPDRAPWCR